MPDETSAKSGVNTPLPGLGHVQAKRTERRRARVADWISSLIAWAVLAGAVNVFLVSSLMRDHQGSVPTRSIWMQFVFVVVPIAGFAIVGTCVAIFFYRWLRGDPLPLDTENTRCGWCQHELRGITTPICSECGHQIGDIGPDAEGEFPQSRRGPRKIAVWSLLPLVFIITTFIARIPIELLRDVITRHSILWTEDASYMLLLIAAFPGLAMMLTFYEAFLQFDLTHSGRAWCRICKAELRELTTPVCPTCGSAI